MAVLLCKAADSLLALKCTCWQWHRSESGHANACLEQDLQLLGSDRDENEFSKLKHRILPLFLLFLPFLSLLVHADVCVFANKY